MSDCRVSLQDNGKQLTAHVDIAFPYDAHATEKDTIATGIAYLSKVWVVDDNTGDLVPVTDTIRNKIIFILNGGDERRVSILEVVATREEALKTRSESFPVAKDAHKISGISDGRKCAELDQDVMRGN